MSLLAVEGITVRFGGLVALSDVSLTVAEGTIHGLIGPNGAGKSTLFNVVSRFVQPAAGQVLFDGRELLRLPPHAVGGLGIARTFQNVLLCQRLTVLDNVLTGLHRSLPVSFWGAALRLPAAMRAEEHARARALEALEWVGLRPWAHRRVSELPFGAQKRVELARALVSRPRLLLLDEPAAGLAEGDRRQMAALIARLQRELGTTVVMVEHDLGLVMDLCQEVTVLDFGRVIAQGPPAAVRRDPTVIAAYIGREAGAAGGPDGTLGGQDRGEQACSS
ncbi:ABC transporter ATP-binding protein [Thermaerobacter subterraneus]|uniref:Amino acid/amide ABC transporter ATP-binding protein 1, HAAT family n=1 Tax=Thermaerobacter subterraneus DSM 13965 TaxID=867903 RepID=K6PQT4_9FIRM|nr:ABC transporter ATP-binding protein [Thermaerobacter subterraneus]EKP95302.1 amino acid/amide ABC transporter ATP-binding protein 1, HAAT family [Thermaerobacter subterraneus DSM 13965]